MNQEKKTLSGTLKALIVVALMVVVGVVIYAKNAAKDKDNTPKVEEIAQTAAATQSSAGECKTGWDRPG